MPNGSAIAQRGIECGGGWYGLIEELLTGIDHHCAAFGCTPPAVTQIKEKFGLLRVYTTRSDDPIRAVVSAAEQRSATCCERCGAQGR